MTTQATVEDIHATAPGMPHVTVFRPESNPVHQVGSTSFVFSARRDPLRSSGHPSVLLRGSRVGETERDELVEVVEEAWLARASARRGRAWLEDRRQ